MQLRSVPNSIPDFKNEKEIGKFKGVIEFEKPNKDLYDFTGKLINNKVECPISIENILLRGTCLKGVSHIFGIFFKTYQKLYNYFSN